MKLKILLAAFMLTVLFPVHEFASGQEKVHRLYHRDTIGRNKSLKVDGNRIKVGDIIRLSVIARKAGDEALKTLKVEIKGDAVENLGVLEVDFDTFPDPLRKDLSLFLRGVKNGEVTVNITPVGEDGKERPVREAKIEVFGGKKN